MNTKRKSGTEVGRLTVMLLIAFFGGMALLCSFAGNEIGADIGEFIYNLIH